MANPRDSLRPRRVRGWLVLGILAAAMLLSPVPVWLAENLYSRAFYPRLQSQVTAASNAVPFAVVDVLLVGLLLLVLVRTVLVLRVMGDRGVVAAMWDATRRIVRVAAVLVILFLVTWGFNYRRQPLEAAVPGGAAVPPTVESLQAAVVDANTLARRLRPKVVRHDLTFSAAASQLGAPMDAALARLKRPPLVRGRPKHSRLLTPFFTAAGINGMVNPFVLESIVHPDLLPFERAFVVAHEWAHLAGYADEAEANAVGWLACMEGPPDLAYSASLFLIMEAGGELRGASRQAAMSRLDPGVRADLDKIAERLRRGRPAVQRSVSRVYDEYLRANRVADGTASYARSLSLILSPPFRDVMARYPSK